MTANGALLFGRYAFPPNQLGYCGPSDHQAIFDYVASGSTDRGLIELERRFEGAYPYLVLIAHANEIADPFDERVVEAYWIGNRMLDRVQPAQFHTSLKARFGPKMNTRTFEQLAGKMNFARPHHNFHVFDIYTRAGFMNDERAVVALNVMDSCRISWGEVVAVEDHELVVQRPPLVLEEGKLALGAPQPARVTWQLDRASLFSQPHPGDRVSIHWSWACDVLTPARFANLEYNTSHYAKLANQTL
ncbi:MAG: DUF6390 family protein [Candidatus Dormiibacterota bacterium]